MTYGHANRPPVRRIPVHVVRWTDEKPYFETVPRAYCFAILFFIRRRVCIRITKAIISKKKNRSFAKRNNTRESDTIDGEFRIKWSFEKKKTAFEKYFEHKLSDAFLMHYFSKIIQYGWIRTIVFECFFVFPVKRKIQNLFSFCYRTKKKKN